AGARETPLSGRHPRFARRAIPRTPPAPHRSPLRGRILARPIAGASRSVWRAPLATIRLACRRPPSRHRIPAGLDGGRRTPALRAIAAAGAARPRYHQRRPRSSPLSVRAISRHWSAKGANQDLLVQLWGLQQLGAV